MAFLACRLGARRVIAVEPDNILQLARTVADANGWGTRIEFLQGLSTAMNPPMRCNVVVSDIGGVLPLFMRHIPTIVDIRERWLVEGGIQIPQEDRIFGAVIESQGAWKRHFAGWTGDVGVDFSPAMPILSGSFKKVSFGAETLLTEPALWASIDYRSVTAPNHEARLSWRVPRDGTGHGVALWFDRMLVDGVTLSNRPGEPPTIAGQLYFPWPQPVALQHGNFVEARIRAHLVGNDYVWAWDTDIYPARTQTVSRKFRQSTLQGSMWTSEWLDNHRLDARSTLGPKGHASLVALRAMERGASIREIGAALMDQFPAEFPDLRQSLGFVSGLQNSYGH
jgi:protein arginine N-methyltransferase 1